VDKVSDHPEFTDIFTGGSEPESQVLVYEITTRRESTETAETKVTVYVVMDDEHGTRIGGIQRQE
jgi:hypothetical protein